ncbi:MAG TPA: hypothetical protein VIF62_30950 [Labilithrix sp.]
MDLRKARRSLAVLFSLVIAIALIASPASADPKTEAAAKALQKKAMEEDYLATEFAKAQEKLDKAIAQCGADKCSAQLRAQLHRDLGVVLVGGQIDRAKGVAAFVDAIQADPKVALDPDLRTKDLDAAFAEAKKKAGSGGGGGGGGGGGTGEQPQGDFAHTPAAEQQIRTPIPIYAEYSGEEQIVKVIARYKGFGMTEWKSLELTKKGDKGWAGLIPCADVIQGKALYYLQGFNANNDPVATGGDRNHPYSVQVKREAVADPPHLPNEAAPKQCADTGDCPPNFPGCHEVKKEGEATGKDGGEFCEEDSECKSKTCKENKCTAPEGPKTTKKFWIGIWGALDYSLLPSADDVCRLNPPNGPNPLTPINDSNYYCTSSGGSDDYPYRPTSTADAASNPRGKENDNLVKGTSDKVSGGGAIGNIRVMVSFDYAVNNNLLVGARAGYVLLTYPGQAAKDDGKTFPPIHLELRGTYLIGKDALAQKIAPYVMAGGGISTWDASVKVSVVEQSGATKTAKDVDAWHLGGPAFITAGGGVRLGLKENIALMGGLRLNLAFGNSFAPSVGPEVGFLFGF